MKKLSESNLVAKVFVAAILAALLVIGIVAVAGAHTSNPANLCQHAFVNWEVNRTQSAEALLLSCLNQHTIGGSSNFNVANFGFNNGFGFNPTLGFNPGFGGFIPFDGFGQNIAECPPGTFAQEGGFVDHPTWQCTTGLGNRFPGRCPLGLNIVELGDVFNPVWDCVQ